MNVYPQTIRLVAIALLVIAGTLSLAHAKSGGDPPPCGCAPCQDSASSDSPSVTATCAEISTNSYTSYATGAMGEDYQVVNVKGANGVGLDLSLFYNSTLADGEQDVLSTVLGFGTSHSYNIMLYEWNRDLFKLSPSGRVTKYDHRRTSRRGPLSYVATRGHRQTVTNGGSYIEIKNFVGQTTFRFEKITGNPLRVLGRAPWMLTKIIRRDGNVSELSYQNGLLQEVQVRSADGGTLIDRKLMFSYLTGQSRISQIDFVSAGTSLRSWAVSYDSNGNLKSLSDPEGLVVSYGYNSRHQMISKTDRNGKVWRYTYDAEGHPVGLIDPDGKRVYQLSNNVNWATNSDDFVRFKQRTYIPGITTRLDGNGKNWQYHYDKNGFITKIQTPDLVPPSSFEYNHSSLNMTKETDANGHVTQFAYFANGNLQSKTDALGFQTTYEYNNGSCPDLMTKMTSASAVVTEYEYDALCNLTKQTRDVAGIAQVSSWTYFPDSNVKSLIDPNNHITNYEYDAFGHLTKTTDAEGNVTTMAYDAFANRLSETDANNHITSFEYDELDRLVKHTDAAGKNTLIFYDGVGNQLKTTDRNTNDSLFDYDSRYRLVKTTDALGGTEAFTYDNNNNRIAMADKNGNVTDYVYDVQNRLIKATDAESFITSRTYDPVGNVLSQSDANGHSTSMQYDALDRLVKTTDAEGNVTLLAYDMVGIAGCVECTGPTKGSSLVTKQTDAEGKVTFIKYDGLDRQVIQIHKEGDIADFIDASDAVTRFSYDDEGNRLALIEPNGNTMTWDYDDINRMVKQTNGAGDIDQTTYDGVNNVLTTTAANGNVTTNTYDVLDRLVQVNDSIGLLATFTYDAVGNRLTEKDGNGNGVSKEYDAIYRLVKVTDALGEANSFTYDPVGNLLSTTDRETNVTTYVYDSIYRRILRTDAIGAVTQFAYDGVGNNTKITDAEGNVTQYEFDDINRLVKESYADSGIREFTYDGVGNLLSRTDQKGQTTNYEYSDLHFLTKRAYPVSGDDIFSYDLSQRMLSACREGGSDAIPLDSCAGWLVSFDYDGANRVIKSTQNAQVVEYAYDIPGRTRTLTYPGGREIVENTDARSRLDTINDTGSPPAIASYSYDLGNRVSTRTYRNGIVANTSYNANNWITQLTHMNGATQIAGFAHAYDKEGNKAFEERLHETSRSEAYQYDDIYRLVDYKVGNLVANTVPAPTTQSQYDLDLVGNWDNKTTDAVLETRTHSATNEITLIDAIPVSHDDNGNTSEDELYIYAYDEENRLTEITRKSDSRMVAQYEYDALSRRVAKTVNPFAVSNAVETRYYYDDARVIEEQDNAASTEASYVFGDYIDEVLTMDKTAQVYYYHQNALWSVVAITDSVAAIVEQYAYDAYGMVTISDSANTAAPLNGWSTPHSVIDNPYLFTGRRLDEEAGLYFYRARYFDTEKGRFLQRDPLGYVDGLNTYEYVKSNPIYWTDPTGWQTWSECMQASHDSAWKNTEDCLKSAGIAGAAGAAVCLKGCLASALGYPACVAGCFAAVGTTGTALLGCCIIAYEAVMLTQAIWCAF